ncbi:Armadillo-like helical [Cynara cardunculus var. scolymus]|uniref:Armadillo-like helical n=1 Tax=Cynara cardunculus var. scolymus TaxID=59895 RepID=A0A103XFR7_CYNCS|nr:Armadillo-like helical [Cynara cardunculus var. scolymus]
MNHYHIYEAIGQGKYSTVYKGRKKKSIEYFAIKSVDKSHKSKVLQEVRILHSLDHPNVLKFYSWYETSAHLWLVLEYCVGGDLRTLLEQDSKLPEDSVHDLARDLVRGLRFLHSKGIIYCDLKPSNILLDENGRTKLCDFGLSRKLSDISKTPSSLLPQAKRGTPCYMAPELFQDGGVHSYASDFWALGCVLYECYAERNGEKPLQNKTPPGNRDNSKGPDESSMPLHNTPSRGISSGRKIQPKASGKVVDEKQKEEKSNTKGVNLLRLSRIAKSNLQRENEKENYRRPMPNNSENDTDVKIENTDMELDFNENTEDETQDEPDMPGTPNHTLDENLSTPDQEERRLDEIDRNTHNLVASPMVNTPATEYSRRTEHESSSNHIEVPATPPTASPQSKIQRIIEDSGGAVESDTSRSSPNLSQVLWHPSDLSVRPVMPSKKSDKGSEAVPSLPFDAMPASDFVKMSKEQLDGLSKSIISILNGNTPIGEKQNVIRYLEMLSINVDAANILTNGPIMPVLVKMLRQAKVSALRVQLASLLGLLIRHSTFIDDDLSNSGILNSLNEGLVDRQEKVRRFCMAALGELLFYISTQSDQSKATNPPESPSKESRTSSGWQGEDDITQLYALRTIENISSQGGYWASRFTTQDVINNLCYIFRAPGKQESMRLTAGSCLVRLVRFNPPSIQQLTLLRVLEAITEEPSVIEENWSSFIHEILPSLSLLCKGSKDGDARFLCLKIWFEVVVNLLNEVQDDNGRREELKSVSRDHFLPLYPKLIEDEDPIPIYAQKLHQMLVEFSILQQ